MNRRKKYTEPPLHTETVIIGGGILGCLIARELSGYDIDCVMLEAKEDVCQGITKANSAILYTGYDNRPGTNKARMTVEGNHITRQLCEEYGIAMNHCGSLMVSSGRMGADILKKKLADGEKNGVRGIEMIDHHRIRELEPNLNETFSQGLYAPDTAVIYPWQLGIAAVNEAMERGIVVRCQAEVTKIHRLKKNSYEIRWIAKEKEEKSEHLIYSKSVINCAGIEADRIREMVFPPKYRIYPTKADFIIYGRTLENLLSHVIFYEQEGIGKGIALVPNQNGAILAGASNLPVTEKNENQEGVLLVKDQAEYILPQLKDQEPIRAFAGLRPNPYEVYEKDGQIYRSDRSIHTFVIEQQSNMPDFISLIGIKTPGITAAPLIAIRVRKMLFDALDREVLIKNTKPELKKLSEEHSDTEIVCQCEMITKGEILKAIQNGADSIETIKRHCGAGFGRCQGNRCRLRIQRILEQMKIDPGRCQEKTADNIAGNAAAIDLVWDVIVIGGGVGGISYAEGWCRLHPEGALLLIEKDAELGGVLKCCTHIGYPDPKNGSEMISGVDYGKYLEQQLSQTNARILTGCSVTGIEYDEKKQIYCCKSAMDGTWHTIAGKQIILASGAMERPFESLLIPGGKLKGICSAGQIQDGSFLELYPQNKDSDRPLRAVILGGGDLGLIITEYLRSKKVEIAAILEQQNEITANRYNKDTYLKDGTISVYTGIRILKVSGSNQLEKITIQDAQEKQWDISCDLLVTAIGLIPDCTILEKSDLSSDRKNQIIRIGNCDHIFATAPGIRYQTETYIGNRGTLL